ncbi:MAG: DinB family protein [Dehalococcoidia bacterium]
MYSLRDVVSFGTVEFLRGLEGLTAADAVWRAPKSDGSQMNAISWTVQHVGAHWHAVACRLQGLPPRADRPPADGTPPSFEVAMAILRAAADDLVEAVERHTHGHGEVGREGAPETASQAVARAVFHTWFHAGEINAVRQLLGHPEIRFIGDFGDRFRVDPSA